MIALVPARKGSKRIPDKNIRHLGDKPLLCWTLDAAVESGCFSKVLLCTDSLEYYDLADQWSKGFELHLRRNSSDTETDLEWIRVVRNWQSDEWCLLRPTSPFRGPETIRRAVAQWNRDKDHLDSLRAVRKATEPAFKQWTEGTDGLLDPATLNIEAASRPTQSLPQCYIQTGGLEVLRRDVLLSGSLSGTRVGMFLTEGPESLDINDERDWAEAERIVSEQSPVSTPG